MSKIYFSNLIFTSQRFARVGLKYFGLCGLLLFTFALSQPVQASGLIGNETQIIQLTNQIRTMRGISALTRNALLDESAQSKAEDMVNKGYFNHVDQDGNRMSYWMGLAGYDYLRAGENLAKGFNNSETVIQAWLNSPTHYANLVNANYTEIGIGVAEGIFNGKATVFVVQHFGQPMPQFTLPTLIAASVLGDSVTALGRSISIPPSTGGNLGNYDLIIYQQTGDNAIINTAPKGLLFVAYESLGDTADTITQTWDGWQNSFPRIPYANDLPRASYQFIQILVVAGWFAGAAWLGYQLIVPILAWFKRKSKFVIKMPSK